MYYLYPLYVRGYSQGSPLCETLICSMQVAHSCLFSFLITNLFQTTDTQTSNKSNLNLMGHGKHEQG